MLGVPNRLMNFVFFVLGLCALVAGASLLVRGASRLHHAAQQGFANTMLGYVLPLTVILLVVSLLRSNAARS